MTPLFAMLVFLATATTPTAAITNKPDAANRSSLRAMPAARTVEATTVVLAIAIPKNGQVLAGNPAWTQFRIEGFALGAASSQFDRADEIAVSKMGQTIHIVIDNQPYFPVNEPALDPFDEGGFYYDTSYKVEIPYRLKEGMHTIRAFPARSFGESLKGEKTFAALNFYIGEQEDNPNMDLSKPFLTYNEPSDEMPLTEDKPILLDFYICNAELSSDGYKVRLTIDGKVNRVISSWQPFYIYGLKKGKHTVRLELLDQENVLVPGTFNDVKRTFTVH